jgi:hypothetical protein
VQPHSEKQQTYVNNKKKENNKNSDNNNNEEKNFAEYFENDPLEHKIDEFDNDVTTDIDALRSTSVHS